MATTTNYGWDTPDDTDLVKDGAAAIRTLGSSVDTTTKALNPSTTLGDVEYRSATANTNTRLPIGTTGQILTVSGGVPAWTTPAGGGSMTLLSTTTLSGASTTISSISGDYKSLKIWIVDYEPSNNTGVTFRMRFNSDTTTSYATRTSNGSNEPYGDAYINVAVNTSSTTVVSFAEIDIPNYSNTTIRKTATMLSHAANYFATANMEFRYAYGLWDDTAAINEVTLFNSADNWDGGTVYVYGVN